MKKTQRLTAVFLLLLILCGCSTPTAPDTIVMPQTSAETRTEPAPVSAEPEPGVFHLEYEQTAHRLLLAPEAGARQITPEQLLDEILHQVPSPRL